MIQKFPKHPDLVEALYYVGSSHEKKGDTTKATSFYGKILSMAPEDEPVHRKAKKALRALQGR
jgi:TolA-binding protein